MFSVDPLEVKKTSKTASFHYRDTNCFIDTRRIFLDITWFATKDDDSALAIGDFVSCLNPPSQQIIESAILNVGEETFCLVLFTAYMLLFLHTNNI